MILNIKFIVLSSDDNTTNIATRKKLIDKCFPLEINGKYTFLKKFDFSIDNDNWKLNQIEELLQLSYNTKIIDNIIHVEKDIPLNWSDMAFSELLETNMTNVSIPQHVVEDYVNGKSYELCNELFADKPLSIYIGRFMHNKDGENKDIVSFSVFLNRTPDEYISYIKPLFNLCNKPSQSHVVSHIVSKNTTTTDCHICEMLVSSLNNKLNEIEKDKTEELIYPFNNEKVLVLAKYCTLKPYDLESIILSIDAYDSISLPNNLRINKNTDLYNMRMISFLIEKFNENDTTFTKIHDYIYNELTSTSLNLDSLYLTYKDKLAEICQHLEMPAIYKNSKFYKYTITLDSDDEVYITIDKEPINGVIYWRYYSKDATDYVDLYDTVDSYAEKHNISKQLAEKLNHVYMINE